MENYLSVLLGFAKESTVDWSSRYKIPSNRVLFTQEISQLVPSVWILIPVFKKKKTQTINMYVTADSKGDERNLKRTPSQQEISEEIGSRILVCI